MRIIYIPATLLLSLLLQRPAQSSLQDNWRIDGPTAKTSSQGGSSSFLLEYTVSERAKFARYRIFQKGCKDEYKIEGEDEESKEEDEDGNNDNKKNAPEAPVLGAGEAAGVAEKHSFAMNLASSSTNEEDQIASVKLDIPNKTNENSDSLPSISDLSFSEMVSVLTSWWSGQTKVEFCIRMGLWLPPEAGEIEVNFRETNVMVALDVKEHTIVSVELEDCPMNEVDVILPFAKMKTSADTVEKKEEPHNPEKEQMESKSEETTEVDPEAEEGTTDEL
ncbi:MAG: hypothetical protein SGILL_010666 [Bacillariaceae sp.]